MINKVTQDMVGLKFHIISTRKHQDEDNEFDVEIRFEALSDEGIEVFGLVEDDFE
jgi:hypothetical protein